MMDGMILPMEDHILRWIAYPVPSTADGGNVQSLAFSVTRRTGVALEFIPPGVPLHDIDVDIPDRRVQHRPE